MNPDTLVQAIAGVMTPLITLITFFSRRRRLRNEIRENLALIEKLDKDEILKDHSPASIWLRGKVTLDVAKLSGQPLGTPKKPVPKGSVFISSILCIGLSCWTYYLNRNGFTWYSLIPGVFAFLFAVSVYGMFINREIPPTEEDSQSSKIPSTEETPRPSMNGSSEEVVSDSGV